MYCKKCGNSIELNQSFCKNCGNSLKSIQQFPNNNQPTVSNSPQFLNNNQPTVNNSPQFNGLNYKKNVSTGFKYAALALLIMAFILFFSIKQNNYYFSDSTYSDDGNIQDDSSSTPSKGKYSTSIITDNTLSGVTVRTKTDAYKLISNDSVSQKISCSKEMKKVEDEIINKYGITAVNLCEMDTNFAKEIGNVFKKIYEEYPSVRGYITNLSLKNSSLSDGGVLASFMPVFTFATSKSSSSYPWVIKTQILLNSTYFLNSSRLDAAVKESSIAGHFPPNATIYSPVAHELGHYLSFIALMKSYNEESILIIDDKDTYVFYKVYEDFAKGTFSLKLVTEAYKKYKNDTNTIMSLDEWRGTISKYALAKDNNGDYIYDETIAESFHDVYLNGDDAKDASKYVVAVLKAKLGS